MTYRNVLFYSFTIFLWLMELVSAGAITASAQIRFPDEAPPPARPQLRLTPRPNAGFVLVDGTPVKLKLMRNLSSATEQSGATVDFTVLEEVEVDEKVVIKQGALALGTVVEAAPKRRMGRSGKLAVQINAVVLADGSRVELRAVNAAADGSRVNGVATAAAVTGMFFFPAAPFFLLIKGKDLTIPQGTFVTAYVNHDHQLDPEKFTGATNRNTTAVNFKCEVEGAEIWIEEKFVGNPPATIRLPEGEYQVVVQKTGYQPWKRKIAVSAGSIMTLTIALEKEP
ncbi:MAG: PEGA domain-containing protein [Acidobacteria bacterium]|nr:PEGA domain-containing protein [Acidobacteriota bacterium]